MKYRTIEEAKQVHIPELPQSFVHEFISLSKVVQIGNESSSSKLKKIFTLTDKITSFVAPYMVCQKGCSHCCKIDVLVTSIEAQYIQKNLGFTPDSGYSISSGHGDSKRPCTFLSSEDVCSIYQYRPFACRTFHAMDNPSMCKDTSAIHATYSSKNNGMLGKLLHMVANINNNRAIRDIRDFFPNGKI